MAVQKIIEEKCIGCRTCLKSCPMDVFAMNEITGKPEVRYPRDCVMCLICLADCPADAIDAVPGQNWMTSGY